MALLRRQRAYEYFDDQDPVVLAGYMGKWTHYLDGNNAYYYHYTYTIATTPGSSLSLNFSGTRVWVYGGPLGKTYPAGEYTVDGNSTYTSPRIDRDGDFLYFESPWLGDHTHTLEIRVASADDTYPFILDQIIVYIIDNNTMTTPNPPASTMSYSSTSTMPYLPTSTMQYPPTSTMSHSPTSTKLVGTIVGGAIGGICAIGIIIILLVFVCRSSNRKTRNNQGGDVVNPRVAEALPSEYRSEPFHPFGPPPPADFSGPSSQFGYSEGSSSRPLNSSIGEAAISSHPQRTQSGPTYVASSTPQPVNKKAALRSQQYEDVQQSSPSYETRSTYTEVPPSYGHH